MKLNFIIVLEKDEILTFWPDQLKCLMSQQTNLCFGILQNDCIPVTRTLFYKKTLQIYNKDIT